MKDAYFKDDMVEMWLEDGVMYHTYAYGLDITLEIAKHITQERIKITNGISRPLLTDARALNAIRPEAREYWSGGDGIKYLNGGAIIIRSPLQKLLGNLFLLINKPPLPAKLFVDKEEALRWLQQYKTQN